MKFEHNKKYTTIALYVFLTVVACLLAASVLINFDSIQEYVLKIIDLLFPFIYAFVIAYLLNPVMTLFEKQVMQRIHFKQPHPKLSRALSIIVAYSSAIIVIGIFLGTVLPQIASSLSSLLDKIPSAIKAVDSISESTVVMLQDFHISEEIQNKISGYITQFMNGMLDMLGAFVPYLLDLTKNITIGLKNTLLGIIISIYMLFGKEKFFAQVKKTMYALLPKQYVDRAIELTRSSHRTFSGFIYGKIIDSLIIGILCYIGMRIFNMPYAALISVIVGVTNVIPYFGPFIGAIPSALIILIESPISAFWFCLFILVLQQFDGNILGPKILGDTTGLNSFWVIFSIIIGGGLFGIVGMFIGVPLFAVIYSLIRSFIEQRLRKKDLPCSTGDYLSDRFDRSAEKTKTTR